MTCHLYTHVTHVAAPIFMSLGILYMVYLYIFIYYLYFYGLNQKKALRNKIGL